MKIMNMTKKGLMSTLILAALLVMGAAAFADTDQPSGWAKDNIDMIKNSEKFRGQAFESYQAPISRLDFIYLAVRTYELTDQKGYRSNLAVTFKDTTDSYAIAGAELGITNGIGNGNFGPDQLLTREQLATLMMKTLDKAGVKTEKAGDYKFADESEFSSWARDYIYRAKANGIIGGVGNDRFDPQGQATVEQALMIIKNILSNEELGMKENLNCTAFFDDVEVPETLEFVYADYNTYPFGGGPPVSVYLNQYFSKGLLNGVSKFDISEMPQTAQIMRSIYRSLYYNKEFMALMNRDFELHYEKRDDKSISVIKAVYKDTPNFMANHMMKMDAFEAEYGKVTNATAYMPLEIDNYREGVLETKAVLEDVAVEKTRVEILDDFEERLRQAFYRRDESLKMGKYSLTSDEVTEVFQRLYYDRAFNVKMNQFYSLIQSERSGSNVYGVTLSYSDGEGFLEQQLALIDRHEGVDTSNSVANTNQTKPGSRPDTIVIDGQSFRNYDENSKGFDMFWSALEQEPYTLDVSAIALTKDEYSQVTGDVYIKYLATRKDNRSAHFEPVYQGDKIVSVKVTLIGEWIDDQTPPVVVVVDDPNEDIVLTF